MFVFMKWFILFISLIYNSNAYFNNHHFYNYKTSFMTDNIINMRRSLSMISTDLKPISIEVKVSSLIYYNIYLVLICTHILIFILTHIHVQFPI